MQNFGALGAPPPDPQNSPLIANFWLRACIQRALNSFADTCDTACMKISPSNTDRFSLQVNRATHTEAGRDVLVSCGCIHELWKARHTVTCKHWWHVALRPPLSSSRGRSKFEFFK